MPENRHLLILGGTGEAAALAHAAQARFGETLSITTSLAGRTAYPAPLTGAVRVGGFGGATGLGAYLRAHRVDILIDATHPFAATMSHHARLAAEAAGVPRLMLIRPPWVRQAGDHWIGVPDLVAAAATAAALGRRIFLTVGGGDLAPFARFRDRYFVIRLVDPPETPLPFAAYDIVVGRGPFALADETRLIAEHAIDLLVCKASGGAATAAKLVAAREAGLPIVMVDRPAPEAGDSVASVGAALDWLAVRLAGDATAARGMIDRDGGAS